MAVKKPSIAVVVADGRWPAGIEDAHATAELHLVSTGEQLDALVEELDVLAVYDFRTQLVHEADWSRAGRIRWVHAASAGIDAAVTPSLLENGVVVTNSRGMFDRAIAEYVVAAMLFVVKDLRGTLTHQARREWRHRETAMLEGKRLLVVGAGSIGGEIGRLGAALGMKVEGIARTARSLPPFEKVGGPGDLYDALARSDFVAIAAPLTAETHHMFDAVALSKMRPNAWLINVGRGPIVDEGALLDALRSGTIAGAALDVFEEEPLPPEHAFWSMENVIVSPHMAGDFHGWVAALSELFVENLRRWVAGEPLLNVVDTQGIALPAGAVGAGNKGESGR